MREPTTLLVIGLSAGLVACGNGSTERAEAAPAPTDSVAEMAQTSETSRDLVADAREAIQTMQMDQGLWNFAQNAKGVFVVPSYGHAGAVVGASGGEGVLFGRVNGSFGDPVFYTLGSVSVGAQFGAEGGRIAMLVMTDEALDRFMSEDNFSLDAQANLTVLDYSEAEQGSLGDGDVILWSDTDGAFAGASLSASDIHFDEDETHAYYDRAVSPADILGDSEM